MPEKNVLITEMRFALPELKPIPTIEEEIKGILMSQK
jgi:hypothetical protein